MVIFFCELDMYEWMDNHLILVIYFLLSDPLKDIFHLEGGDSYD